VSKDGRKGGKLFVPEFLSGSRQMPASANLGICVRKDEKELEEEREDGLVVVENAEKKKKAETRDNNN
jgi:hypothetical protein